MITRYYWEYSISFKVFSASSFILADILPDAENSTSFMALAELVTQDKNRIFMFHFALMGLVRQNFQGIVLRELKVRVDALKIVLDIEQHLV